MLLLNNKGCKLKILISCAIIFFNNTRFIHINSTFGAKHGNSLVVFLFYKMCFDSNI